MEMTEAHVPQVVAIEQESFSVPWSAKSFVDALALDHVLFCAALDGARVAGYCGIYLAADEGEITNVAVSADYRRRGIGRMLVGHVAGEAARRGAERIFLEVRQSNEPAIRLYEGLGFVPAGIRKGFYERPREDALVMLCECGFPPG